MRKIEIIIDYLRTRQSYKVIALHITIITLVLSQIIVSNFMGFNDIGEVSNNPLDFYGTWMHIIIGLLLIPITLFFIIVEIKTHSFKHFFPYVFGQISQLKSDVCQLMKFKIPETMTSGIAAVIEGLGLGALFLVLLSGSVWFLSWNYNLTWSHDIKEVHEFLTGFVQAYLIGHGCMGIMHIYISSLNREHSS